MRECFKCGKPTELPTYTISEGEQVRVLHLCEQHAKPIRDLFKLGLREPGDAQPSPPARAKGHAIIPVD